MQPLHFGDSREPLFGWHHAAQGTARRTAVLICPAWGMEYMRSYRGTRLLAMRLAEAGYETLRFDYSCTGDSSGAGLDARLQHWIADTATASRELREMSGAAHLAVIGLRLGALIGAAARQQGHCAATHLIGWDAPADGAAYVQLMRRMGDANDARKQSSRHRDQRLPPAGADELNAFPWPAPLAEAVAALPPATADLLIHSSDQPAPDAGTQALATAEAAHWQDVRWIGTPWVPAAGIRTVVDALKERLP